MRWVVILPIIAFAGFSELEEKNASPPPNRKLYRKKKNTQLQKLIAQEKKILELLERQEKSLIIKNRKQKIAVLSRFRGVLLNSIIATSIRPSKFIVRILGGELSGAELRCAGHSFEKRVLATCDLLVFRERSYPVQVEIWDLDGAEGIISDHYYTGEEKEFISSSFASFLGGITKTGDGAISSALDGAFKNMREKIAGFGKNKVSVSFINSKKEVLVFFNKTLTL